MRPKRFLPPWLLAAGFSFCCGLPMSRAAILYWDGTSTGPDADGGAGTWNTSNTNWDTAAIAGTDSAWVESSDAVFGGTGGTVTLGLTAKPGSLTFQSPGYVLTSGTLDFQVPTVIATGPHDVTISSRLAGFLAVTVTKTGTGTLTVSDPSGSNFNFGSNLNVQEGVLKLGTASALGNAGSSAINTSISAGAMLDLNGCNPSGEGFGIAGTGVGGAGAIVNNHPSTAGGTGSVYLTAPATIGGISRWDMASASVLGMGGHALTKVGPNEIHVAGSISTPGRIDIKAGSFWFDVGSSKTFAGNSSNDVTVRSGALLGMTSSGTSAWSANFETNTTWRSMQGTSGSKSTPQWNGPVNLSGTTTVDVRDTSVLSLGAAAVISGTGTITKTGAGTLSIASASTYTGGTTVNGGTLLLQGRDLQTGSGAIRGTVILNTGTTLRLAADQALGTASLLRVTPLNATGALVESTATGVNTLHVAKLSASTLRSTEGGNSPDAAGYFQMASGGGQIQVLSAPAPSVIGGRLDLGVGPGPTSFSVANGDGSVDLRVDAALTGSTPGQGMTKTGDGLMFLGSPATFTGATTVEQGILLLGRDAILPSSPVTVKPYALFGTDHPGKSLAPLTVEAAGQLILPAKTGSTTVINGPLNFPNGNFVVSPVLGAGATTGVIDLATAASITGTGTPVLEMTGAYGPTRATGTVAVNGNKLQLTLSSTGGELVWNNATAAGDRNGTWDTALANFSLAGNNTTFQAFDRVTFNDSVAPGEDKGVTLAGTLVPALITVDNSNGDYWFTGTENLTGIGSLLKTGSSTLTIGGPGGYPLTGDITAAGGILDFGDRSILIDKLTLSGGAFDRATATFKSADFQSGSAHATLTGSAPWTKTTPGTATLSGVNTLTGPGTVAGGTLRATSASTGNFGSTASGALGTSPVNIAAGATLDIISAGNGGFAPNTFSGTGTLVLSGSIVSAEYDTLPFHACRLTGDTTGFQGNIRVVSTKFYPAPALAASLPVSLSGNAYLHLQNQVFPNALGFENTAPSVSNLVLESSTQSGPVSLSASGTARIFSATASTLSGPIQDSGGPGSVSFEGNYPSTQYSISNRLTLSGNSTYTGPTTVTNEGVLNLTGSLGATAVTVTNTGTIGGSGTIGTGGSLTFQQNGRLWVKPTGETLTVNGNVDLGTMTKVVVDFGGMVPRAPFPVLRHTGALTGGVAQLAVDASTPTRQAVFDISPGLVTLNIGSKTVVWKGQSHNKWQAGSAMNWNTTGVGETESYYDGDSVVFDDTGATQAVWSDASFTPLRPSAILFDNSTKNYVVSCYISGPAPMTKRGTGHVRLEYGVSHTGGTFVEAGSLQAGTLGTGPVNVSAGATLMGTLTIPGTFTCAGILDPGTTPTDSNTATSGPAVFSGTYKCHLDASDCDSFTVNGDLDLTGSTLAVTKSFTSTVHPAVFTILTYSGNLTGTFANVTGMPEGFKLTHDAANKRFTITRTPFSGWIDTFADLSDRTPGGDPDGDGFANLTEYVLGGHPGTGNTSIAPTSELTSEYFIFSYKRSDSSVFDTDQVVQWSTDMATWTNVTVPPNGSSSVLITRNGDLPDDIRVQIARPAGQKVFARLKATPK